MAITLREQFDPELRKQATKMAMCGERAGYYVDPESGRTRRWVHRCKQRLCPRCAINRAAKVVRVIDAHVGKMDAPRFMTLTMKHTDEPLRVQQDKARAAFSRLRRMPDWKTYVDGGVYVMETTLNETTGQYHVHFHIIYDGRFFPKSRLSRMWEDATGDSYIVDISAVENRQSASLELAKYIGKPEDIAEWPANNIREYALAIRGTHLLRTFGNRWGQKVQEEQPMPAESDATYFVSITKVVARAAQHLATPCALAAAIAVRDRLFARYVYRMVPFLKHSRSPPPPRLKHGEPDPELFALFQQYHAEELAGDYDAADYRSGRS